MKQIIFLLLIAFIFKSCSNGGGNRKVTVKRGGNKGYKIEIDKVSTIQKLIIGHWLETNGDSNSIMTISKDSIIGGFSQDCWSKYKIKPEKDHLAKTKDGQYWFGFTFQRCQDKDNESFNEYFGNILVDSLYLRCHDGIDDGETVVFKRLK